MTELQAESRVEDLKMVLRIYKRLLNDVTSVFYKDDTLKLLLKKTDSELMRLEELLYNQELEDSEYVQKSLEFKTHNGLNENDLNDMALEFNIVDKLKQ